MFPICGGYSHQSSQSLRCMIAGRIAISIQKQVGGLMYVFAAFSGDRRPRPVAFCWLITHVIKPYVPVESFSVAHTRIGKSCPELLVLPRWDAAVVRKNAAVLFDFLQRLCCSRSISCCGSMGTFVVCPSIAKYCFTQSPYVSLQISVSNGLSWQCHDQRSLVYDRVSMASLAFPAA